MAQEQSKKQGHWALVTESYWKLQRLFYWILFLTIREYIWMKWRAPVRGWHESLCTLQATLCREVKRLGLTTQSICHIVLQLSKLKELWLRCKLNWWIHRFLYGWMRQDVTREISLEERHMIYMGHLSSVSGSILHESIFRNSCNVN